MGDISFYKTKDGNMAREKSGVSSKRFATDPAFARTRENVAEFTRAAKAGKLLRSALHTLIRNVSDHRMVSRLTKQMMEVIKADAVNDRGERNVIDGEALLLEGFEFNANAALSTTFFAPYTSAMDRAAGILKIDIPAFVPAKMITAPPSATHFKLVTGAAEVDFEAGTSTGVTAATAELVYGQQTEAVISLSNAVTANSTHPLFLALGIEFYQQVNNKFYALNSGASNPLALIKVDGQVKNNPGDKA